ncbi:50S ribosomal protein L15e [Candidatus Woesearchaeota archaeon]|nr:50S ribosomal protein L15e [Candidatus Woesearchaeota archaeon]
MGYLKYFKQNWNSNTQESKELNKERLMQWRREPVTVRIHRPTRLDRARSLGYKAKKGFILVRQKATRGGRQRPDIKGGRRTAHSSQRKDVSKNYQLVCEERAAKKYVNCEVLNSYYVGKDGKNIWYEVILIERDNPSVFLNKETAWALDTKNKVLRGLTSAGRKSRGLRKKGIGSEKTRPSRKANKH